YDPESDQGACAERYRAAQNPKGLRNRLRRTQEADPHTWQTSGDAIAHDWVRLHYPDVDLGKWEPFERPGPVRREQLVWTREEVILAMDFYIRVGAYAGGPVPGQTTAQIGELSELLKKLSAYPPERQDVKYRNPNGVYKKLMNLRAIHA